MRRTAARAGSGRRARVERPLSAAVRPQIDYRVTGRGWAACDVRFGKAHCEITASYISDAFGDLVRAAAAMACGTQGVTVSFAEEPGEYRWVLTRLQASRVEVAILTLPHWHPGRADEFGEELLRFACPLLEFGRAVMRAANALQRLHGEAGYLAQWGKPFPGESLDDLRRGVAALKREAGAASR